jgi:photosystem II stability/assembly factor-like uncharacterized protein
MRKFTSGSILALSVILIVGISGCKRGGKSGFKRPHIPHITSRDLQKVIAFNQDQVLVIGAFGYIAKTFQGSSLTSENSTKEAWEIFESGIEEELLADVHFIDSTTGWIVGLLGTILHTTDGGRSWVKKDSGTKNHLFSVYFTDAKNGWAVGAHATIIHTRDGGETWEKQEGKGVMIGYVEVAEPTYNDVYFFDETRGFIAGEFGTILRTEDGGLNWTSYVCEDIIPEVVDLEFATPQPSLYAIYFADEKRGWIVGQDGVMLLTENGGGDWRAIESNTKHSLYSFAMVGNHGWVVGSRGAYVVSKDGGLNWQVKKGAITTMFPLSSISFCDAMNGWVVGTRGTIFKTKDGGATWEWMSGVSYTWPTFEIPRALGG